MNEDIWVVKTESSGTEEWSQVFGGEDTDTGEAICETDKGDFMVTGSTYSWGAGKSDVILLKIENKGHITGNRKPDNLSNKIFVQNYPNPFVRETIIRFNSIKKGHFKIRILDVTGREISVLLDKIISRGLHEILWNGTTNNGVSVRPGIYFCELTGENGRVVIKLLKAE